MDGGGIFIITVRSITRTDETVSDRKEEADETKTRWNAQTEIL